MTLKRSGNFIKLAASYSDRDRVSDVSLSFFARVQGCLKRQFLTVQPARTCKRRGTVRRKACRNLRLFEIALLLVRLDHVASRIVNADHCIM